MIAWTAMIMDLRTARIDNGWILFSMAVGAVCCTMEKGIAGMFFYAAGSSIPLILIILFGFAGWVQEILNFSVHWEV